MKGSTYAAGGTRQAWLDITYNYSRWYRRDGVFPGKGADGNSMGLRSIYGLSGADSIPALEHAAHALEGLEEDLTEEEIQNYEENGASSYWPWQNCGRMEFGRGIDFYST